MISHAKLLLVIGIIGIAFYAAAPILFPHVPNLRQPELLPVYSLMMGLGGLLRKPPSDPPSEDSSDKIVKNDNEADAK